MTRMHDLRGARWACLLVCVVLQPPSWGRAVESNGESRLQSRGSAVLFASRPGRINVVSLGVSSENNTVSLPASALSNLGGGPFQDLPYYGPLIKVSTDTLWVTEETVHVENDTRLPAAELARLVGGELAALLLSSQPALSEMSEEVASHNGRKPDLAARSGAYAQALGRISQLLSKNPDAIVRIVAEPERVNEASAIYRRLVANRTIRKRQVRLGIVKEPGEARVDTGTLPEAWHQVTVQPAFLRFQTSEGLQRAAVNSWRLQVRNPAGEIIKTMAAEGGFPGEMKWNWQEDGRELATPGHYSYTVTWRSPEGTVHTAVAGYIKVIRKVRHVTYRFSKVLQLPLSQGLALFLIIR